MRDLERLEKFITHSLERSVGVMEKEILGIYRNVVEDIEKELAEAYKKYSVAGKLTKAEMTKYHRLTSLEKQLNGIIGTGTQRTRAAIERLTKAQYRESFFMHGWAVEQNIGASLRWGMIRPEAIAAAVENPLRLIAEDRLRTLGREKIRRVVAQGLTRGVGYPNMAREVEKAIIAKTGESLRYNAMRIVRTEAGRAQTLGQLLAYDKAEDQGLRIVRIWTATLDDRTRDKHQDMDGVEKTDAGFFMPGVGYVEGPGLTGIAEEDINCFPGFVSVGGREISGATKRAYSGRIIRIETASGLNLTVTPNHPIFTEQGWIPAYAINKRSSIITMGFREMLDLGNENIQNCPTVFSEIFDLLSVRGAIKRTAGMDEQFHGDGREGDVDIVTLDGQLLNTDMTADAKHIEQGGLPSADILAVVLASYGAGNKFGIGARLATNSGMRGSGESGTFGRRSVGHSNIHGLATGARGNAVLGIDTLDHATADTVAGGGGLAGFAGLIARDNVVRIDRNDFSGHVYNLHTESNWFIIADNLINSNGRGAIVHNCRCRVRPHVANIPAPIERRIRNEGLKPYVTYSEWRPTA